MAEVPLVDFTAVEVLSEDFMGGEADSAEVEVQEVTDKPYSLFPINSLDPHSGLLRLGRLEEFWGKTKKAGSGTQILSKDGV